MIKKGLPYTLRLCARYLLTLQALYQPPYSPYGVLSLCLPWGKPDHTKVRSEYATVHVSCEKFETWSSKTEKKTIVPSFGELPWRSLLTYYTWTGELSYGEHHSFRQERSLTTQWQEKANSQTRASKPNTAGGMKLDPIPPPPTPILHEASK